jgi:hypothetical protein
VANFITVRFYYFLVSGAQELFLNLLIFENIHRTMNLVLFVVISALWLNAVVSYDPEDKEIETIIPKPGDFEAFYPREMHGISNSVARAPHAHGSFFQHRNPGKKTDFINYYFKIKIHSTFSTC